jgi:hypothetical protein
MRCKKRAYIAAAERHAGKKELARTDGERLEPGGYGSEGLRESRCVAFLAVASRILYNGCYCQMKGL